MKCPNCHKAPLSFTEFTFRLKLESIECKYCGNKLQREQPSRLIWYLTILATVIISALIAGWAIYLQEVHDWNLLISMAITIALIAGISASIELLFYLKVKFISTDNE